MGYDERAIEDIMESIGEHLTDTRSFKMCLLERKRDLIELATTGLGMLEPELERRELDEVARKVLTFQQATFLLYAWQPRRVLEIAQVLRVYYRGTAVIDDVRSLERLAAFEIEHEGIQ